MKLFILIIWLVLGAAYYLVWDVQLDNCCKDIDASEIENQDFQIQETEPEDSEKEIMLQVSDENISDEEAAKSNSKTTVATVESELMSDGMLIYFSFNSSEPELPQEILGRLNALVDYLKQQPSKNISIIGHTDSSGPDENNYSVGLTRAQIMRNYLVESGIAPNRVVAESRGETQPIADNQTEEGRAKNRRTEINLINE